jgi:hypothetical protein
MKHTASLCCFSHPNLEKNQAWPQKEEEKSQGKTQPFFLHFFLEKILLGCQ